MQKANLTAQELKALYNADELTAIVQEFLDRLKTDSALDNFTKQIGEAGNGSV